MQQFSIAWQWIQIDLLPTGANLDSDPPKTVNLLIMVIAASTKSFSERARIGIVRLLEQFHGHLPAWLKRILKPLSAPYLRLYRWIFSSLHNDVLVRTPAGPMVYVNYSDDVERAIANGTWEKKYMNLFCSQISGGETVVDVGAYIGIYSLVASQRVGGSGCVYSFEPMPGTYSRLMRNIRANGAENIKAYNFGLSDKNETRCFTVPRSIPAEATLCQRAYTELTKGERLNTERVEARVMPFDQFCKEQGLHSVDIVKMDVTGSQLKVLRGMENTLANSRGVRLFLEVPPPSIEQMGDSLSDMVDLLIRCGFGAITSIETGIRADLRQLKDSGIQGFFGSLTGHYTLAKDRLS